MDQVGGEQRREHGVGGVEIGRGAQQHVGRRVVGPGGPGGDGLGRLAPRPPVVEGQRGPVVDQVRPTVPTEHVDVPPGAVDVAHERVEPQHAPGELRVGGECGGVEVERAGQEVDAEVQAGAAAQEVLHLLVGFGRAEGRVELDRHQLRHGEPEPPGQLAADDLGDEHRSSLARAGVLHHVGAEVVGLHQPGQRTALAQRRHVPDGGDVAQRGGRGHREHDRITAGTQHSAW